MFRLWKSNKYKIKVVGSQGFQGTLSHLETVKAISCQHFTIVFIVSYLNQEVAYVFFYHLLSQNIMQAGIYLSGYTSL